MYDEGYGYKIGDVSAMKQSAPTRQKRSDSSFLKQRKSFLPVESLIKCVNTSGDDINAGNEKWVHIFER
jgi:hypothetical protein